MTIEGTTRGIAGRRIVIGSVMLAMFSRLLGSTLGIAMLGSILNAALLSRVVALPSDVRAAAGGDGVGVTSVLLDAQARAALDPAVLMELQAVLAGGIQEVFFGVVVSAVGAVAVAWLLPLRPAEEPAEEAASA